MITIHTIIGSPFGRAAIVACLEKGAPYRVAPVKPGDHKGPAYLAMHPFGRIPTLEDDGFVLYETQAILRYLDAVGHGPSLTPADPRAAARMNQAMGIIDWYFFSQSGAMPLVFARVVAPRLGVPVNEAAAQAALPATRHLLKVLAGFVETQPYFAGEAFSLADIHVGTQMAMLAEMPEAPELLAGSPLVPWLDRVRARPSFAATTWDELEKLAA
jgi:glutathione S-transferase